MYKPDPNDLPGFEPLRAHQNLIDPASTFTQGLRHSPGMKALSLVGAILLTCGVGAASAKGLEGGATSLNETHDDWTVVCRTVDESVRCAISQTQVNGENRQRVLAVELAAEDAGESARGTLVLPFGLQLKSGIDLAIDESGPFSTAEFSTCLPAGCLVPLAFDAAAVKALKAGSSLRATAIVNDGGREVKFGISLKGFSSALGRAAELVAD